MADKKVSEKEFEKALKTLQSELNCSVWDDTDKLRRSSGASALVILSALEKFNENAEKQNVLLERIASAMEDLTQPHIKKGRSANPQAGGRND